MVFPSHAFAKAGSRAARHIPEGLLPQVLLRGQLKPESQLRKRKQLSSWERELSKQNLLQLGTFRTGEKNEMNSDVRISISVQRTE